MYLIYTDKGYVVRGGKYAKKKQDAAVYTSRIVAESLAMSLKYAKIVKHASVQEV